MIRNSIEIEKMIVNFEFLDNEPIHNVITALNFAVDKIVFFGFDTDVKRHGDTLTCFLQKYCDVKEVEFVKIPRNMLREILEKMRTAVLSEKNAGNQVFFDLTGGDELPLVALGMLAAETELPMHVFNVEKGQLKELEEGAPAEISRAAVSRKVPFDVKMLIELREGRVNEKLHKTNKAIEDEKNQRELQSMISMFEKDAENWSERSAAFIGALTESEGGQYYLDYDKVSSNWRRKELRHFYNELLHCKLISETWAMYGKDWNCFTFASDFVRRTLSETGAVLELKTCLELRKLYGIAELGVHVDWNGILDEDVDVINEVDVIAIDGYTPILVSCKCGNGVGLQALYELDTVAQKFGGRYARKILVSAKGMSRTDTRRAEEMGIEVRTI